MCRIYAPEQEVPNIIVIGVPNKIALNRVVTKLEANQIPHYTWEEPDYDFGITAIATIPLSGKQRELLTNYQLYSPVTQIERVPASKAGYVGSNPAG